MFQGRSAQEKELRVSSTLNLDLHWKVKITGWNVELRFWIEQKKGRITMKVLPPPAGD